MCILDIPGVVFPLSRTLVELVESRSFSKCDMAVPAAIFRLMSFYEVA